MMGLRDDALRVFTDVPSEKVTVNGLVFEVRGLSVKDANALYEKLTKRDARGDVSVDRERWNVEWVLACTYDPESGDRVFDPADRDTLMAGAAFPVQTLATVAARLSGFGGSDADAAKELKSESA